MIEAATRRRLAGDWRGACAAADMDLFFDFDSVRRRHGSAAAASLLADLRSLAPDLLRWQLPRCGHGAGQLLDGLLIPLAQYTEHDGTGTTLTLAAATPTFSVDAGERIVLAVLEGDAGRGRTSADMTPAIRALLQAVHPRSVERYDLRRHRMFWDATCAPQLRELCSLGTEGAEEILQMQDDGRAIDAWSAAGFKVTVGAPRTAGTMTAEEQQRLTRWLATVPVNLPQLAGHVRDALPGVGHAVIRCGSGAIVLSGFENDDRQPRAVIAPPRIARDLRASAPTVPDAAWARPIDVDLLRLGLLEAHELHPLVASEVTEGSDEPSVSSEWRYSTTLGIEDQYAGTDGPDGQPVVLVRCGTDLHRIARETVIASVHEPSDFSGLPVLGSDPATEGVAMAPPDWAVRLRRSGDGLLFLDELSSAPPAVQAALLRVVLERRVGSLALPDGVRIVAAANPPSSAADGWQLAPPLANRFVHLEWVHDPAVVVRGLGGTWPRVPLPRLDPDRLEHAVTRARSAICGFLTVRPDYTHRMPTSAASRSGAWPSPRTWEMALRLLAFGYATDADDEAIALAVRGAVGDGAGMELLAFLERHDLPDPEAVLDDPREIDLPERGDLVHAVLSAVVDAIGRDTTEARWRAGWVLIERLVRTVPVDLLVAPAMGLAELRDPAWPPPMQLDRLGALEELLAWSE